MSTRDDVRRVNESVNRKAAQMLREFAGTAWAMLYNGTPVDTPEYTDVPGVARGNWTFSVGSDTGSFDPGKRNPHGPVPALPDVPLIGQQLFMTNHTPYGEVLEFGGYPPQPQKGSWNRVQKRYVVKSVGGYSQQAPQGWVRLAAAHLEPEAERIVSRLRGL